MEKNKDKKEKEKDINNKKNENDELKKENKRMSKNKFDPLYSKVLSSGYDKVDFERDRKIKLIYI